MSDARSYWLSERSEGRLCAVQWEWLFRVLRLVRSQIDFVLVSWVVIQGSWFIWQISFVTSCRVAYGVELTDIFEVSLWFWYSTHNWIRNKQHPSGENFAFVEIFSQKPTGTARIRETQCRICHHTLFVQSHGYMCSRRFFCCILFVAAMFVAICMVQYY